MEPNQSAGSSLEGLLQTRQDEAERGLAARYAPLIQFDAHEPFLPSVVGYTVFRANAPSPSFPRQVELRPAGQPPAELAIEYAVWWDWDITHLYELEHLWVFVDEAGRVVRGEGSWHGGFNSMTLDGGLTLDGDRLVVFSEPGKHAFAPHPDWYAERRRQEITTQTTRYAGSGGVWVTPLFEREIRRLRTPYANSLVRTYLQRQAFEPAWDFSRRFAITPELLVPWPALRSWIPGQVARVIERLAAEIRPEEVQFLRIAHRGASAHAPENTLAAIRKAAELGAQMVELDVHLSADGVPVVIHDFVVEHRTDGRGAVKDLTLAELKKLDAGGGEQIPTLEEAIECCKAERLGMYLELKAGAVVRPVVEAIQRHYLFDWVVVGSFRPDWLAAVRYLEPRIATSILFNVPTLDAVKLAQAIGADYVHPCWESLVSEPHTLLTVEWVREVRQAGLGIILWHEERPSEIAALRRLGVDGICSDAPELLC